MWKSMANLSTPPTAGTYTYRKPTILSDRPCYTCVIANFITAGRTEEKLVSQMSMSAADRLAWHSQYGTGYGGQHIYI